MQVDTADKNTLRIEAAQPLVHPFTGRRSQVRSGLNRLADKRPFFSRENKAKSLTCAQKTKELGCRKKGSRCSGPLSTSLKICLSERQFVCRKGEGASSGNIETWWRILADLRLLFCIWSLVRISGRLNTE